MNITEANATQRVAAFLRGDVDHEDETTRAAVARDILWLEVRSHAALGAGPIASEAEWDQRLCNVTFEGGAALAAALDDMAHAWTGLDQAVTDG